eukprot:1156319-Pelagomonas_calceolata.AAC.17
MLLHAPAQLTFTADALDVGGRCLHHDFVRYFGLGRSVICMYQDRITPYTVLMPKLACVYGLPAQLKWLRQEVSPISSCSCPGAFGALWRPQQSS